MGYVEKDFLMRYFNQLGIVLAKILGLKNKGKFEEANQMIEDSLADFGLMIPEEYLSMDDSIFIAEITGTLGLNKDQIRALSELLFEKGDIERLSGKEDSARNFLSKTLILLDYLTGIEKVFSFEREDRIKWINSYLSN
jgi:hypothetical protein